MKCRISPVQHPSHARRRQLQICTVLLSACNPSLCSASTHSQAATPAKESARFQKDRMWATSKYVHLLRPRPRTREKRLPAPIASQTGGAATAGQDMQRNRSPHTTHSIVAIPTKSNALQPGASAAGLTDTRTTLPPLESRRVYTAAGSTARPPASTHPEMASEMQTLESTKKTITAGVPNTTVFQA